MNSNDPSLKHSLVPADGVFSQVLHTVMDIMPTDPGTPHGSCYILSSLSSLVVPCANCVQ